MLEGRATLPRVGMVGGGQLSRMTHQAGIALGVSLQVLADATHDSAAQVAHGVTVGDHRRLADLRQFARSVDVVTFDHEHVPGEHLRALAAEGFRLAPGPEALAHAQDKLLMRRRLAALGLPQPAFAEVTGGDDVARFAETHGWPVVAKAIRGGYDGKGVWVLDGPAAVAELLATGTRVYVERLVPLRRELAAQVARSPHGQAVAYPVVETVQVDGVCREVLAPAPGLADDDAVAAQRLALRVAGELGVVGMLAVELFDAGDEGLLVNELAMRPHNSGHWTIEGARTSQFEQHLRAVLDLPLGSPRPTAPYAVMANVLGGDDDRVPDRFLHVMAHDPEVKVHLYGKQVRPGRKVGHVTALGDDLDTVRARARHAAEYLRSGVEL